MTEFRALALVALAALIAACSRAPTPAAPDSPSTPGAAAADAPSPPEGAPRIALSSDQVHIDYRVYGSGTPIIVLIHGWSCDANYWSAQIPALRERYTVAAVNLAGHGASSRNRTDWSMASFGEDVAAVVRALPEGPVILVGHSMGGPVALEAARLLPDRVIGVIGVDTFGDLGAPVRSASDVEARIKPMREDYIGYIHEMVPRRFFGTGADPALVRRVADDMALAPPEVAIPASTALLGYDANPTLAQLHVPVRTIDTELTGPLDLERIRRVVPGFHATVMPGLGHFPMMEDPAAFNRALEAEIAALLGSTPDR